MPRLCITVDLDRDANVPVPGSPEAGSADRGSGTSPRFESAGRGLKLLADLFDELNVPVTFFAEARTLEELRDSAGCLSGFETGVHGYAHEDLSVMGIYEAEAVVVRAADSVEDITGHRPRSFRAPYMRAPCFLPEVLEMNGFRADSSTYSDGGPCLPRRVGGITEMPVYRGRDGRTSYLWPMHEGRRSPESYAALSGRLGEGEVFVLCDHCWHIAEHCDGRLKDGAEAAESVERVRRIICSILDLGFVAYKVSDCVLAP